MADPYHHVPRVDRNGKPVMYGTQSGTYIDPSRHLIVTHTHRGELGSWFTFRYCMEVHGFPQSADDRRRPHT